MKILITGTHLTPAQAVIEEFKKNPEIELVYVGRKNTLEGFRGESVESRVLPKSGVKFLPLVAGRLRRELNLSTLIALIKIPIGFVQSFFIIISERPSVVLSFGGYVALPVVFWAWLLSIPIIVHEQTLVLGLANALSSFLADKIAVSFDKGYLYNKKKVVITGNPIRKELLRKENTNEIIDQCDKEVGDFLKAQGREGIPLIYITGGNQGSEVVNKNVLQILDQLTEIAYVIHQCGDSKEDYFGKLTTRKDELKKSGRYLVRKWFDVPEVVAIFAKADLAVSRGGVNTLSELAFYGIPAIIIPHPNIYQNEQYKNAKYFESLGLCQIILQSKLNSELLYQLVRAILKKNIYFKEQAKMAKNAVIADAAKRIALETRILVRDS